MKPTHIIWFLSYMVFFVSCNSVEHGTLEHESISKKVFDAIKNEETQKFTLLLPDKESYKKYLDLQALEVDDLDQVFNEFVERETEVFTSFRNEINGWESAVHANFTEETKKENNVTVSVVTTKININNQVIKYRFTAIKINSRWFCMGNFKLLKPEVSPA